jgi:hypothetical protein
VPAGSERAFGSSYTFDDLWSRLRGRPTRATPQIKSALALLPVEREETIVV